MFASGLFSRLLGQSATASPGGLSADPTPPPPPQFAVPDQMPYLQPNAAAQAAAGPQTPPSDYLNTLLNQQGDYNGAIQYISNCLPGPLGLLWATNSAYIAKDQTPGTDQQATQSAYDYLTNPTADNATAAGQTAAQTNYAGPGAWAAQAAAWNASDIDLAQPLVPPPINNPATAVPQIPALPGATPQLASLATSPDPLAVAAGNPPSLNPALSVNPAGAILNPPQLGTPSAPMLAEALVNPNLGTFPNPALPNASAVPMLPTLAAPSVPNPIPGAVTAAAANVPALGSIPPNAGATGNPPASNAKPLSLTPQDFQLDPAILLAGSVQAPKLLVAQAVAGSVMLAAASQVPKPSAPAAPALPNVSLAAPNLNLAVPNPNLSAPNLALAAPAAPSTTLTAAQQATMAESYRPFLENGLQLGSTGQLA